MEIIVKTNITNIRRPGIQIEEKIKGEDSSKKIDKEEKKT